MSAEPAATTPPRWGFLNPAFRQFETRAGRAYSGMAAAAFLVLVLVFALFRTQIATHDPLATDPVAKLQSPSPAHLMGTDELGRDVFSRLVYGSRNAVLIGVGATTLGVFIGTVLGLTAGYFRGAVDAVLHGTVDACLALPPLVVLLSVGSIVRLNLPILIVALGLLVVSPTARVVRAATFVATANPYVEAATVIGAGAPRILMHHILPSVRAPVVAMASVLVGNVILVEASLSFLNLGIPPPEPTWGNMLAVSSRRFIEDNPWLGLFPGLAIGLTVLSVNILGDVLRDALDPHEASTPEG